MTTRDPIIVLVDGDSKRERKRNAKPAGVYRTGGAYQLIKAFALLDISPSMGHLLIKQGRINVVRLSPRTPRITDAEISRLLGETKKDAAE